MKAKRNNLHGTGALTIGAILFLMAVVGCSQDNPNPNLDPLQTGEINGTVKDENGNPYPNTRIVLFKDNTEEIARVTQDDGGYVIKTKGIGAYEVEMKLPLSTEAVNTNPKAVNLLADVTATVDFVIKPIHVKAHLNFDNVQLLEEIVDENGNTPTSPNELLYAKNIFDAPLGMLTEIRAPDGHHVTLEQFKTAKGNLLVYCNGNSSTIEIALEGVIPNGTYTFWLAYLNKTRKVGESVDFANDFVNFTNPPIGASNGTENIAVADENGTINVTMEHASCILTDEVALVIPILYHINGQTFGGGHVPDPEEMVQMLVYFQ